MSQNPLRLATIVLIACSVASAGVLLGSLTTRYSPDRSGHVHTDALWDAGALDVDKAARAIDFPAWTDDRAAILRDDRSFSVTTRTQYEQQLRFWLDLRLEQGIVYHWREQVEERAIFAGIAAGVSALLAVWTGRLAKRWRMMEPVVPATATETTPPP